LRLLPPQFRKLLHAVACSPLNPPAASDFCNFFRSKTSFPLLYLRLVADESMPLHSLQSKVMGLRGYYVDYVRSMIRASDGEVLDSLAFRPDASPSILARINECRYYRRQCISIGYQRASNPQQEAETLIPQFLEKRRERQAMAAFSITVERSEK